MPEQGWEDYQTRKGRLEKTRRQNVHLVFPKDIYSAFKQKCDDNGWKYNERLLHLITRDLTK